MNIFRRIALPMEFLTLEHHSEIINAAVWKRKQDHWGEGGNLAGKINERKKFQFGYSFSYFS